MSDVREGGTWTALQSAKNAAIYALSRLLLCAPLPARARPTLGRGVGALAYLLFGGARRTAHANLALALPALDEAERRLFVRRTYAELGRHLVDTAALLTGAPLDPLPLDPESRTTLDLARAEGRGVVFASAHLGPWERVAASLIRHGVPLTVLAREGYDARMTALYERLRRPLGVEAIYRGHATAPIRIVRALRSGRVLGIPMDLRSRVPSVLAPFLGVPAPTAIGPARVALRTRAAVVVGTVAPGVETDRITFTRVPTADLHAGPAGELELTRRINAELSRRILAMPHAWPWMHPRWS